MVPWVFDYGNNLRTNAKLAGVENAFDIPGFVPEYIRPLFCEGKGPFRWVALSGDAEDIRKTDQLVLSPLPGGRGPPSAGSSWPASAFNFKACPPASAGLGYGQRAKLGLAMNELVRFGRDVRRPS